MAFSQLGLVVFALILTGYASPIDAVPLDPESPHMQKENVEHKPSTAAIAFRWILGVVWLGFLLLSLWISLRNGTASEASAWRTVTTVLVAAGLFVLILLGVGSGNRRRKQALLDLNPGAIV